MNNQEWHAVDLEAAQEVTNLGIIEFQANDQEWHDFSIVNADNKLVFGGACNTGFLQSGFMEIDDCFSLDENLQELLADLETFYNDGPDYTNMIIFNERM